MRDAVFVTRSGDWASHGSALAWFTGHAGAPEVQYLQCGAEYCVAYSVASVISLPNASAFELIVIYDSGCFCSYTFSTGRHLESRRPEVFDDEGF